MPGNNHPWRPSVNLILTLPVTQPVIQAGPMVTTRITQYRISDSVSGVEMWAEIGGTVYDATVASPMELPDVWVAIEDAAGQQLATTTTDSFGRFIFNQIRPGTYQLRFIAVNRPCGAAPQHHNPVTNGRIQLTVHLKESRMGIQVSYPGIYVQEFTPGAPIQGVGTSTAAFIGTAFSGPVNTPLQLTSWDEFQSVYGGFIADPPTSYLAPAVYGFFQNGGTNCYIVRVSKTAAMAKADLLTRQGVPQTDLVATSLTEGIIGNAISVQVIDSSRLAAQLKAAGSPATALALAQAHSKIIAFDSTATLMTLASNTGFVAGDRLELANGGPPVSVVIGSTQGSTDVRLLAPARAARLGGRHRPHG